MWLRTVRRATRSERQRRDWRLLTCTWRNQPVRMICATLRGRGVPAAPRGCPGIVAIGLVRHGLHRRIGSSRLDADRRPAGLGQPVVQPSRQRTGLHTHPFERQLQPRQGIVQRVRRTLRPNLLHDRPGRIDHTDRGLFQRHVQSCIVRHGCSFAMLVAVHIDHVPTSRTEQPPRSVERNPNQAICPKSFLGISRAW